MIVKCRFVWLYNKLGFIEGCLLNINQYNYYLQRVVILSGIEHIAAHLLILLTVSRNFKTENKNVYHGSGKQ